MSVLVEQCCKFKFGALLTVVICLTHSNSLVSVTGQPEPYNAHGATNCLMLAGAVLVKFNVLPTQYTVYTIS